MSLEKRCHIGALPVFSIGNATVYGARETDALREFYNFDVVISLLGWRNKPEPVVRATKKACKVLPSLMNIPQKNPAFVSLEWPDMGVPALSADFWQGLASDIKTVNGNVLVYCMGGHGRTGTALSLLAHFGGGINCDDNEGDLVEEIRMRYCEHAVEAAGQIDYLQRMGIETQARHSNAARKGKAGFQGGGDTKISVSDGDFESNWLRNL